MEMKIGARNQLVGKVVEIQRGPVMAVVKVEVEVPAGMASVMTVDSLDEMALAVGDRVQVVAKAVNVLLLKHE